MFAVKCLSFQSDEECYRACEEGQERCGISDFYKFVTSASAFCSWAVKESRTNSYSAGVNR